MEDLIKREDAIRVAEYPRIDALTEEERVALIMEIPSAENKGEWIYGTDEDGIEDLYPLTCSICGEKYPWQPNFCPNCGARMVK